jgi:hypothetical protein
VAEISPFLPAKRLPRITQSAGGTDDEVGEPGVTGTDEAPCEAPLAWRVSQAAVTLATSSQ